MLLLAAALVLAAPHHPHVARYTPHVVLTWTHDGAGVVRFEIERAVGSGTFTPIGTSEVRSRTYRDATSRSGVYRYRIRAVGAGVVSPWSDEILVKVRHPRP
jgi:hypothetical protein